MTVPMMMKGLTAERYVALDRCSRLDEVQKELEAISNAQPTQIHPSDREAFLRALLSDLEDKESAPWTIWSTPHYLLALTAVKSLSRNPVGSTIIIDRLRVLLHHTALPLPPPASPFSHPPNDAEHPTSLEAIKVLANVLVLHDAARRKFAEIGGGKAIAKALKEGHASAERLFLLGRIGFLVTLDRGEVVRQAVDKEDLINSLVLHISSTTPIPANYAALSEMLKMSNNVVRFYPTQGQEWSPVLNPLLAPVLSLFHSIPSNDLFPPLTHTIHVLLSIPFAPVLLGIWTQGPARSPPTSALDKLSSLLIGQAPRISMDSIRDSISLSPSTSASASTATERSSSGAGKRRSPSPPRTDDPTALPARLLKILDTFFTAHLPVSRSIDDERQDGIVLDEALPPVLLFLSRALAGVPEMKIYVKAQVLPPTLDRSAQAGPLERRPGVLGGLLRLLHSAAHTQSRDTAGEVLWTLCDADPATLSSEIGYGNAAGLLFRKGLSGPPEARIEELDEQQEQKEERNPITSLRPDTNPKSAPDPLEGMTQEEKEREAERLFVLFDRMERNPVISAQSGASAKDVMRGKLERGELEAEDALEDREKREQERRDEQEAMADLRRYKERKAR